MGRSELVSKRFVLHSDKLLAWKWSQLQRILWRCLVRVRVVTDSLDVVLHLTLRKEMLRRLDIP
jgi:hypothetical protein